MDYEVEPVYTDGTGNNYYFGTPQNPYNFFPNISGPMISREASRLITLGGQIRLETQLPASYDRQYIESHNRRLVTLSRRLGRLPLAS